jgi:hypothetical protein
MQPYMEAQYVNISFLLILNTGAIHDAYRKWQRRTPVNQTLQEPNGNSASYHALQAAQVITLPMLQNIMATTPFLLTVDL